jgi:hypothetical protein
MAELFDDLTRILGSGMSRRKAIRMVVGATAGGYLSRFLASAGVASLGWPDQAVAILGLPPSKARAGKVPEFCSEKLCPDGDIPAERQCPGGNECCPDKYVACKGGASGDCCPKEQPQCCFGFNHQNRCCPEKFECCGVPARCCQRPGNVEKCCLDEFGDLICCKLDKNCCCGTPAKCQPKVKLELEAYHTKPLNQIEMGIEDPSGTGIVGISVVVNVNAEVDIPALPPGTTYARVTATRVDQSKPARIVLRACTGCGANGKCCQDGDPVLTTLQIPNGQRRVQDTFADIPKVEHFVTVQNGSPGLQRVWVNVNGLTVGNLQLRDREVRMLDVAREMMPEENLLTLTGEGAPGSSALIVISDVPGIQRAPNALIAPAEILWEPGSWRPGVDLHWGR